MGFITLVGAIVIALYLFNNTGILARFIIGFSLPWILMIGIGLYAGMTDTRTNGPDNSKAVGLLFGARAK